MLKLNKKQRNYRFLALLLLVSSLFFFNLKETQANSLAFNQVKTPNSSTVYYIHQATGQRKAYINEAVFLDYGNSWQDVKTISPEVLDRYIDVRLVKTASSDDLYYINVKNSTKIKMNSLQDILNYNLENVLPITISEFELEQYQSEDNYQTAGLEKDSGLSLSLAPFNIDSNGLVLVPGTKNNALMSLQMTAGQEAAILNNISFSLSGLYNSDLIDKAYLVNTHTGEKIKSSSSFRDRQVTIRFNNNDLIIPANQTLAFELRLDFNLVDQVHNQNLRASLESSAAIEANVMTQGVFPIIGPEFKFLEASNILAQVEVREESLNNQGSRQNLAVFTITETSGQEDIYIRELVFRNQGSASSRDLETFRLRRGNQVISAAPQMSSRRIVFPVNYLRVPKGSSITVSVSANLALDYQADRSVNLDLEQASIEGATYSLFLPVDIVNLDESFILQ
jgi:hypothetical protein